VELFAGNPGVFRIPRETAGNKSNLLIECGCDTVHTTDKGALTSANHSHS
jgi:hypothetical protein